MPEPLKHLYNLELLTSLSKQIKRNLSGFDTEGFITCVLDDLWEQRELKDRMMHVAVSLHHFLPAEYPDALRILEQTAPAFSGFEYMFFPGFVERYGLDHYQESIEALECFTRYASSEFAVRPFIKRYGPKMMRQMEMWASSDDHHVRRLASEGCRPRLPWAMALPEFKQDPGPVLVILEQLKNDESEFVRRSVANNLNDIAKDHPEVVISVANRWLGASAETDWLVKHACRTLLKQGVPEIMALFGYRKPDGINVGGLKVSRSTSIGKKIDFSFNLKSEAEGLGKIRIEYAVDFVRKNGTFSRKVFKISESDVPGNLKQITKSHLFKRITTRKYYPGRHVISVIVNGVEKASTDFMLTA